MKIVVDTNIIFSILLNTNSRLGSILFNSKKNIQFYSCSYMRIEISKHWDKLKKISNLSETQLQTAQIQTLSKIRFINEEIIPAQIWLAAEELTKKIDPDDIDFVALTIFLKGMLWTGDKELYNGLKKLEFLEVINTPDLQSIIIRNQN